MEVAPPVDNSGSTKRRKVGNGELMLPTLKSVRIAGCDGEDVISGDIPVLSCCSVERDLKESGETEITVRRESPPLKHFKTHTLSPNSMAELKADSGELQVQTAKTPPAAEIEEFFAAAEKEIQNRFKNKYNYDIVKDVPLKGRYEWIQLKQ